MANELAEPGVRVIQQLTTATPTIIRPTLVPHVCGPAKEVIEVTLTDGTLNKQAKQGTYSQLPKTVSQTSFPNPRGNILELDVEESTIKVFFLEGGNLKELSRDPGEAFLIDWNKATRAAVQTLPITGGGLAIDGKTLVLAIDDTARLNTTKDVVVTFVATTLGGNLTAQQIADQIDAAVGDSVCSLVPVSANNRVQIASNAFGARSSVTLRPGASALNALFGSGFVSPETRVEASGFRAQDLQNNTTVSPWVEWTRGLYLVDGVATTFPAVTSGTPAFGLIDGDGVFTASQQLDVTFAGNGSILLAVGDQFFADGTAPSGAFVMKVEATRFKLGTLDSDLSTFDATTGKVVSAVYDPSNVNTLFSAVPFSPRFAWFQAHNLTNNPAALPAIDTGAIEGTPATQGIIESGTVTVPASLSGLTLIFTVTKNGVDQADQTFTFSHAPYAAVADIAADLTAGLTDLVATDDGGKLKIATLRLGAHEAVRLKAASTALTALNFPTGSDIVGTGTDVVFVNTNATVRTAGNAAPFTNLATKTLKVHVSPDGGTTKTLKTHTFGAGPFANVAAVVTDILGDATFIADVTPSASGTELVLTTKTGGVISAGIAGHLRYIDVDVSSTGINGAGLLAFAGTETDVGEDELAGHVFKFKLNGRPKVYQATLTNDSLPDAVAAINAAVGFTVAAVGGTNQLQLVLTSTLAGEASQVQVVANDTSSTQASRALGFGSSPSTVLGSGRPNPDLSINVSGAVVLGAEILRNAVSGAPFEPGAADTYIQYRALRKDVSPSAKSPAILNISDVGTLQSVLNPLNAENPLGLGMFFMLINAPGLNCTGFGVDEITAAAPDGTLAAYARVANALESEEVYAIAPLTHDETVAQMFQKHVDFMSLPDQKGERILFFNPLMPTRAVPDIVASGLSGNTTATSNEFILDVNPASPLNTLGINTAIDIPVSANLYVQIVVATSSGQEVRIYSVKHVNGPVLTLRVAFAAGENDDGFYSVTPLTETLINADWTLAVRGDPLVIAGSTLPDKEAMASTLQLKGQAYKDRRLYYTLPDTCKATVAGLEAVLPGYYMCAAIAGMTASQQPQQGFTNLPMAGFTGVVGSNGFFSTHQLNVIAAGGIYIIVQNGVGAPLTARHQLSTDLTSIETRELSITKVVDFVAKFKRAGLRAFIGTFNITQPFLDTLSTVIHGMSQFLIENGVLVGCDLNNLIQDKTAPDTVLIDETLDVPFPCNYIQLTLKI